MQLVWAALFYFKVQFIHRLYILRTKVFYSNLYDGWVKWDILASYIFIYIYLYKYMDYLSFDLMLNTRLVNIMSLLTQPCMEIVEGTICGCS